MQTLSIGTVARRVGLRPSALRYYESVGLLPSPARVNGRRIYDETIFAQVAILQLAQKAGLSVAEIATLLHGFAVGTPPATRWQALAPQKLRDLDAVIARARQMKEILEQGLGCTCRDLTECAAIQEKARQ